MNQTLSEFKILQDNLSNLIKKIDNFLQIGESLGAEIDKISKDKLVNLLKQTENQKLKIALIGGFSEGKTSIAAAWLGKLDKTSMKISQNESSDEIQIYEADNIEIIDTPGLFGFKEKFDASSGQIQKYKDITKKYISEANLIFYVMNSTNPIKDSHKEDLQWLFRELNLLPRTIFVLSRFDEVADVEDENDYMQNLNIKKQNVIDRLNELLNLNLDEKNKLSIVGVSANPFGSGIEYYLNNLDEFKRLSHIQNLQDETTKKIKQSGGNALIISQTANSITRDIINNQLPQTQKIYDEFTKNSHSLQQLSFDKQQELENIKQEISQARIQLRESITKYFKDLILELSGTEMETFNDFITSSIGDEGILIRTTIQNYFENLTGAINNKLDRMATTYIEKLDGYSITKFSKVSKDGINFLTKSNLITSENIKIARNVIVSTAKIFNIDLVLKFKPWGAIKLASSVNKALPFFALALEAWDSWSKFEQNKKFKETKEQVKSNLCNQQKEILDFINGDNFIEQCFNKFNILKQELINFNTELNNMQEQQVRFNEWKKMGQEIIDAEIL
jgi:Dynamin family.